MRTDTSGHVILPGVPMGLTDCAWLQSYKVLASPSTCNGDCMLKAGKRGLGNAACGMQESQHRSEDSAEESCPGPHCQRSCPDKNAVTCTHNSLKSVQSTQAARGGPEVCTEAAVASWSQLAWQAAPHLEGLQGPRHC